MATNDARMEVRLPEAEKRAVIAGAERAGQNPSVWARRAFAAALVGQGAAAGANTCGFQMATPDGERQRVCVLARGHDGRHEPGALETAPSEAKGVSAATSSGPVPVPILPASLKGEPMLEDGVRPAAQSRAPAARPRRADVGPKPASASPQRPKSKAKGGKT